MLSGPNQSSTEKTAVGIDIIASGGVASLRDIKAIAKLANMGVSELSPASFVHWQFTLGNHRDYQEDRIEIVGKASYSLFGCAGW